MGRFTSYAITTPDGEIAAVSGGAWTDTEQKKNVTLAAGASETYERVFAVGERADVASIVSELTKASAGELGGLEISLVDAAGKPVRAPTGAKVVIATAAGAEVMSIVAAKDDATFGGELPPGTWIVSFAPSAGRRSVAGRRRRRRGEEGRGREGHARRDRRRAARCIMHGEGRLRRRGRRDAAVQDHGRGARAARRRPTSAPRT